MQLHRYVFIHACTYAPFEKLSPIYLIFQVELTVTPRVEGILKIVGVKWKLSSLVVGFHNFESNSVNKRVAKGRRKAKHSPSNDLKFIVIKVHVFPLNLLLLWSSSLSLPCGTASKLTLLFDE